MEILSRYNCLSHYFDNVDLLELRLSAESDQVKLVNYIVNYYNFYKSSKYQTIDLIRLLKNQYRKKELYMVYMNPLLGYSVPKRIIKNNAKISINHVKINIGIDTNTNYIRENYLNINRMSLLDVYSAILRFQIHIENPVFINKHESQYNCPFLSKYGKQTLLNFNGYSYKTLFYKRLMIFDNMDFSNSYMESFENIMRNLTTDNYPQYQEKASDHVFF